jgi:CMP-N-acetylneuraminic acid synthetase
MAEVLGLITARGGSKGVERKNVRDVGGRPLLAWTAEAALGSRKLGRTILSTDDDEIAGVGRSCGIEAPFRRPAELSGDASAHIDVVLHALAWLEENQDYRPDYVMLLQPTSPLRTSEDIDDAIELAVRRRAEAVVSVVETHAHPYLTRRIDSEGRLVEFLACPIAYARRQDLPEAYAINGAIYFNQPASLRADRTFTPASALAYVMPPERSLQIDTPWDLELVDLVLRQRSRSQRTKVRVVPA